MRRPSGSAGGARRARAQVQREPAPAPEGDDEEDEFPPALRLPSERPERKLAKASKTPFWPLSFEGRQPETAAQHAELRKVVKASWHREAAFLKRKRKGLKGTRWVS